MRLKRAKGGRLSRDVGSDAQGFSLLEVVIAAAIVLMTVTAVTACVTTVSRVGQRMETGMRDDRALASVAEWLRSLPYCADELPAPSDSGGPGARDLVAAVFPHACSWANTQHARFVTVDEDGAAAGSFVTRLVEDGVVVVCVARFRAADADLLSPEDVEGFDVTVSDRVPSAVVELTLTTEGPSGPRTCRLVRVAAATAVLDPEGATG